MPISPIAQQESVWKRSGWKLWGGALATIGATGTAWLLGALPAIWSAIISTLAWCWALMWHPIGVPVVLLAAVIVLALIGVGAMWPKSPASAQAQSVEAPPLGELEIRVLRVLAKADGASVYLTTLADSLSVPFLRIQQAAENLFMRQLIQLGRETIYGPQIFLSREGRDYVLAQGYPAGGLDERGF